MLTEKAIVICLLQILSEHSDENHILQMREIISKINTLYGINPDRRTIYSAVALLNELEYDISTYEENGKGYYLKQRVFELGEVHLLMDAVYSFSFLPPKHTEDLISKLQKLMSVHQRKRFKHLTIARPEVKTPNRQVFFSVEQLDTAISKKVKVKFTYLQYELNKKLVPRREQKYIVNPYGMVYQNDAYYLVCIKEGADRVSMYRIDRMQDIELTCCDLEPRAQGFDPNKVTEQAIYAFSGEPEPITMLCARSVLDHVIDKFGAGIHIREKDMDKLEIRLIVSPKGVKFWALQYLPYVEVLSPQWLRDEIMESIKNNSYLIGE